MNIEEGVVLSWFIGFIGFIVHVAGIDVFFSARGVSVPFKSCNLRKR